MAKGSGLSIDSDPIRCFLHHHQPTVINSFPDDHHHHHHFHNPRGYHHPKLKLHPMDLNCDVDDIGNTTTTTATERDFFAADNNAQSLNIINPDHRLSPTPSSTATIGFKSDVIHVNTGLHLLTANTSSDLSVVDDVVSTNSEERRAKTEISVIQSELERMTMENRRLRETLNQMTTNFNALREMHLVALMQHQHQHQHQQQQSQKSESIDAVEDDANKHGGSSAVRQFLDLVPASTAAKENTPPPLTSSDGRSPVNNNNVEIYVGPDENGSNQAWVPNKAPRVNCNTTASSSSKGSVENQPTEATMRKARVSVRTRSEAPNVTDGCQWRKYGQKMAKGNPCPRAYYRCTMAGGCPVRKQVQRCAEDRSILITTYEGNHNHPLPPAAMGISAATSSAARMLLSGSMSSIDGITNPNFFARTLLPCSSSSVATISASAPFPTVTLDLTQTPNAFQHLQSQLIPAGMVAPTALLPQILGQAIYNQSKFSDLTSSIHDDTDQSAAASQIGGGHQMSSTPQGSLTSDTVTALASDPNFAAALAAAITSMMSTGNANSSYPDGDK